MSKKIKSLADLHNVIEEMDALEENSPAEEEEVRPDSRSLTSELEDEEDEVVEEGKQEEEESENTDDGEEEPSPMENEDLDGEASSTETSSYTPNLKYKAMKEEYELPDYLASVIDSPEKEEEIKKIYSKAKGMDHFAQKNESMKAQLDQVQPVMREVQMFNKMIDDKNYHGALKLTGITDDDILRVASDIISIRELTPEQQAAYNNNIQSNQRLHQLEIENQRLQQQFAQTQETTQLQELESIIIQGDTAAVAGGYDQRMGKAGAFRDAVINHAAMIEYQTRSNPNGPTILSPREAVESYVKAMGFQSAPQMPQQVGDAGMTQTDGKPTVIVKKEKPTIPNVRAGNKNPVRQKVRRLADLHALADELDEY